MPLFASGNISSFSNHPVITEMEAVGKGKVQKEKNTEVEVHEVTH